MATKNRLWSAERIRGELLKLGIKLSKRTVQKYMRSVREHRGGGQRWATFGQMSASWGLALALVGVGAMAMARAKVSEPLQRLLREAGVLFR